MSIQEKTLSFISGLKRTPQRRGVRLAGRGFMIWGAIGSAVVFLVMWAYLPITYTFFRSFYDWRLLSKEMPFVGLDNYHKALFDDPYFWNALGNSFTFALGNVGIGTFLCLTVALMIHSVKRFTTFFRSVYFLPVVISMVPAALVWQFIYQPRFGILNNYMFAAAEALHLPPPPEIGWLTRPEWAMRSLIIFGFWKFLGFRMTILLAGLQNIPEDFYEAARIDGAGHWAQFRHITIPLLVPALAFVLVTGTINSIQAFAQMQVMTGGGPARSTETIVMLVYNYALGEGGGLRFGYAAAISYILFGIIFLITVFQLKVLRPRFEY